MEAVRTESSVIRSQLRGGNNKNHSGGGWAHIVERGGVRERGERGGGGGGGRGDGGARRSVWRRK